MLHFQILIEWMVFAPLLAALITGVFSSKLSRAWAHWLTTGSVALSLVLAIIAWICYEHWQVPLINQNLGTWMSVGHFQFSIGFWVDRLSLLMSVIVTFVSLLVHVYSIAYMAEEEGYQRFFSYISAFTFAMLVLVLANNLGLLFFGWEAVGFVSYLLIGFWFKKEAANVASLKAFLVNRVGDFGLLLGLAAALWYFDSLDYVHIFSSLSSGSLPAAGFSSMGIHCSWVTLITMLLLMGALGKSAQIPLHVWLEGSMEGPTPISALIHAATMVTAGVFMLARLSPLFEHSEATLNLVLILGSLTCLLMGLIGLVQNDIKRVVAYSTLSQLGYMMSAQGASAYAFGIFHLTTHAAFKALLFLAAGSVILALHHEQDIQKMGGLRKRMPFTYGMALIGVLALVAIPPFAGFYSKDLIIEAVSHSLLPAHHLASFCLLVGVFVTALYSFRWFFLIFHGKTRLSVEAYQAVKESPAYILWPLAILSLASIVLGAVLVKPILGGFLGASVQVLPAHQWLGSSEGDAWTFVREAFSQLPLYLTLAGILTAWICYVLWPKLPGLFAKWFKLFHFILLRKYGVDDVYGLVFATGARVLGFFCWQVIDLWIIDRSCVEGSAKTVRRLGLALRRLQTGFMYHYTLTMILGLAVMMLGYYYFKG